VTGRVLALRALGLGDVCTAVPALRALRRAHPDHELILAGPAWAEPIVRQTGVDRIVDTRDLDHLAVRVADRSVLGPIDVAVNLHGRGPQSTALLTAMEPGRLIAFAPAPGTEGADPPGGVVVEGPEWCADEPEVVRWCRLLSSVGVPADPDDLSLHPPIVPSPLRGAVVVHPGAASAGRRWPPERFAAVVRHAAARGRAVAVTGSEDERELTALVVELADARRGLAHDLGGRTDLTTLCALVAGARAVVANDTGVAHLATAFGVPSVVLFGPTPPRHWGARNDGGRQRAIWHGATGDPHAATLDPGLASITVDEVISALDGDGPAARPPCP
jgi:ADP-heptose:LPS heptosyltransferase